MFWRVLSYHLVFTLAAGPLLCCCTAGRALASTIAGPVTTSDFRREISTLRAESPCCALKNEAKKGSTGRKPSGPIPTDHCPCKGGNGQQAKIQPETSSPDTSSARAPALDSLAGYGFAGVDVALPQCWSESGTDRGTISSLPSTFDLLFAHHNLRC
jgi:hypothetical protein